MSKRSETVSFPPNGFTTLKYSSGKFSLINFSNNKAIFLEFSDGFIIAVFPAEIAPINGAITNWNG